MKNLNDIVSAWSRVLYRMSVGILWLDKFSCVYMDVKMSALPVA